MRIIKRTEAGNLVVFVGPNLELEGQLVSGNGWSYLAPEDWVLVLEEADLPEGFVAGGWTYTNGVWTINATGRAEAFPGKRRAKLVYLADSAEDANYEDITYNNIDWPTDEETRDAMAQILSVGSVPVGMYWRDSSGVKHDVTYQDLQSIGFAIVERALTIDTKFENKKIELAAANTIAAINAITW